MQQAAGNLDVLVCVVGQRRVWTQWSLEWQRRCKIRERLRFRRWHPSWCGPLPRLADLKIDTKWRHQNPCSECELRKALIEWFENRTWHFCARCVMFQLHNTLPPKKNRKRGQHKYSRKSFGIHKGNSRRIFADFAAACRKEMRHWKMTYIHRLFSRVVRVISAYLFLTGGKLSFTQRRRGVCFNIRVSITPLLRLEQLFANLYDKYEYKFV